MENSVEKIDKPLSEEETKTADGGISQLKLANKAVHVFHESKDSEGDDVFEEAMMDANPEVIHAQELRQEPEGEETVVNGATNVENTENFDSSEVNGSNNEVHEEENFEEAIEIDLPSEGHIVVEDIIEALVAAELIDEFKVANEAVENSEALVASEPNDEVRAADIIEALVAAGLVDEVNVANEVVTENTEALVALDPVDVVRAADVAVDEDNNVHNVLSEESNNSVVGNDEGNVKDVSTAIVYGETQPFSDADPRSNGSCRLIIDEKSEKGDMVKLEEKPFVHEKSLEIGLSHGNESREQFQCQDDYGLEMKDDIVNVDTLIKEEMGSPKTRAVTVTDNLGASIEERTEALEIKNSPSLEHSATDIGERVKVNGDESEAKDFQNSQSQQTNENIENGSDDHPVVEDPKVQETQNEQEKQGSVSTKDMGNSNSAREPEIQRVVDPVQPAPPPAGLGGAAPLLEPTPRVLQQSRVNSASPQRQVHLTEDPVNGETEENDETREKLQMIRVKFLRLARRLGQTPHNVVVAQVLYRLGLAEQLRGRNTGRIGAFSFDRASAMAEQLEAAGQEPLDFSCTIMVLGKTGVGKSATINSIFDEVKFSTDAFQMGTKKVQDVVGTVQGIKIRVIDTPGLLPCWSDQPKNEKILHSVKRFIKKTPPDIVLYLDRLDMQSRDFGDMPLLRTITEIFGPSIWFNAIVVLTHAASAPPDGPNGVASSYEMFVTQRSHVVQQAIRQVAGDMRLMNPVALVENHSACRTNRAGQRVLPNGQVWKPHLLLLSFASKILAEANTLLKLQDSPPGKPFAARPRVPPLPFLLSSLLQPRSQLKLPEDQFSNEDDFDEDLDESSDSDTESDYDELPPFKRLTKDQLEKLSKTQKNAYFDELEYREKLYMKKQLKEERKRRKLLKKMAASSKDLPNDVDESVEEESSGAASVPVPMPDFALPTSFDSDNPTHRYRFLDSANQWLVRPVLETHGWDHDVGYEGINVERSFIVNEKIPVSFSGQVTKDKKESSLQMELASSIKHGEGKATSLGFDMQTVGKDMSYTLRSETRFSNFRHNKTAAGLSVTLLGDAFTAGLKLEDQLIVKKRFRLVLTGGAMTGRGDVAYGGSLEATLRDKDFPLGRTLSTLGLSIMDWHGDLAIGCNVQSQIPIGRTTNMIARANLNNRGAGQISIRLNSSEQLQIALIGLLPLFRKIHGHYQQMRYAE